MSISKCLRAFESALNKTQPIVISETPDPTAIRIVNIVASVHLLPENYSLCIPNIIVKARGAAKYTPDSFQAMVLRFGDNSPAGNATALIYPNGKINIVGAVNREHARFAAQQYRLFLEEADYKEGHVLFSHFKVYNTVICSELGFRPNLSKLQQLYPMASDWQPELFPGLRLQVWLKKKSQCKCPKRKNKPSESCECNSMCLVFDTGRIVITGIHDYRDAPQVYDCIRMFFSERTELQDNSEQVPRHLRWNYRNAQKLAELEIDFIGTYNAPTAIDNASKVLEKTKIKRANGKKAAKIGNGEELPPIFQACDAGQVEMVEFLLMLNEQEANAVDDQGRTPLERLMDRRDAYADKKVWRSLMNVFGGGEQ